MTTPNARTRELLEAEGYTVALVERYCTWSQRRFDLFGFIDLLAVRAGEIVAIQSTTDSNLAARRKKLQECETVPVCIAAGVRIEIHGWRIRARRWELQTSGVQVVMQTFPGFDKFSPTLQRSPLGGDCMGPEFKRWRTAYLDRNALIFSGDLVQLRIHYDDGTHLFILKELRVTRDGRWWSACVDGVFQLGALVQPTAIVKVVALSEEYYAPAPIVTRQASPETIAHYAELAQDAVREWETIGHADFVRFPGLSIVNYRSPSYRSPEPLCCPK